MITKSMLESWRLAKNEAILSLVIPPDIVVAIQEMYIEAKALRKDNLQLLDKEELLEQLLKYVALSAKDHYLTEDLEEQLSLICDLCDELNIDLELDNDDD